MNKYEFTGEVKQWFGRTLRRIRATANFGTVQVGTLGGWIEKEENLSHDGNAWVYGHAVVCDDARISGNARIYDNAQISGDAHISGEACIRGNTQISCNTHWVCVGPVGSRGGYTTFARTESHDINVSCGCFCGNVEQFTARVRYVHGDNEHARAYMKAVELAEVYIDRS